MCAWVQCVVDVEQLPDVGAAAKKPYGREAMMMRKHIFMEIDFVWNFNTSNYLNINHSPLIGLFEKLFTHKNRTYLNKCIQQPGKCTEHQHQNSLMASRTLRLEYGAKRIII
jgi:hypothetical protein